MVPELVAGRRPRGLDLQVLVQLEHRVTAPLDVREQLDARRGFDAPLGVERDVEIEMLGTKGIRRGPQRAALAAVLGLDPPVPDAIVLDAPPEIASALL